jgi:hypothetical protein
MEQVDWAHEAVIDESDVMGCWLTLPTQVGDAYVALATAERTKRYAYQARKRMAADLLTAYTADAAAAGQKMTVGAIDAAVERDHRYQAVVATEIEADYAHARQQAHVEMLRAKKDALVSLSAHERAEIRA